MVSILAVTKEQLVVNEKFRNKPNFTIKSIMFKHPARDIPFEYMKDLEAFIAFQNEIFRISNLKCYVMDGSVFARDIMFDIAGLNLDAMEYKFMLDVTNVDINKLDEPDPAKKTRDAELSLNANFHGRGLNVSKELTPTGYINIYKIGSKFANRLMRGLSEEQGKSKLGVAQIVVDNSMTIRNFNFNLDKGLMYVTVNFGRKILSGFASIKDNQVKYDRVPLQEFVRNIMQEEVQL